MICSPGTLPHVRLLLLRVATADASDSSSGPIQKDSNAVLSSLRGQKFCRFFLETVHVLLPLIRHPRGTAADETCSAFFDVAAILLRCTLRGHQVVYLHVLAPLPYTFLLHLSCVIFAYRILGSSIMLLVRSLRNHTCG